MLDDEIEDDTEAQGENDIMQELSAAWDAAESETEVETEVREEVVQASDEPVPIGEQSEPAVPIVDNEKAPVSMSASAREKWKNTPDEVKQEFSRLDKRMEGLAQKYGRDAQRAQQMDQTLQPYSQLFAMNGGAQNTLPGLLQTAAQLQMGSAPQKAQAVASIIKQFGVDIVALDNMLVGQPLPPEMQKKTEMEQMLQQHLAPVQQQLQHYQQREMAVKQAEHQQINGEIQNFSTQNEFYNDVRSEMADILDLAANRNRNMTLQEAYDQACHLNPQIRQIIQARGSQATVQSKRKAGSSIYGTPSGNGSAASPDSMRHAIENAWENIGRS